MKSAAIVIAFALLALAMSLDLRAQAATPDAPVSNCVEWASIPPWKITRCEGDWGEVCFMASSGFMQCRFD